MKALSGDARSTDGKNASFIIADEVHSYDSFDTLHSLTSGNVGRQSPVTFMITTAGSNKGGPGYKFREHCTQVLAGEIIREDLFVLIYTIDPLDDWKDETVWIKSLPSLGVTVDLETIRKKIHTAQVNPSEMNDTLNKTLNIWTESSAVWISEELWDRCNKGPVDLEELRDLKCWGGLDLAYKSDFTVFTILFEKGDEFIIKQWPWVTENEVKRFEDVYPYWKWQKEKLLTVHMGDTMDAEQIGLKIASLIREFDVQMVAYDPAAFDAVYQTIVRDGIDGEKIFRKFIQGSVSFTPCIKAFEDSVVKQKLNHCGDPVLKWMVQNATLRTDNQGLIKFWKEHREQKIDAVVSGTMAFGAYLECMKNPPVKAYDGKIRFVQNRTR